MILPPLVFPGVTIVYLPEFSASLWPKLALAQALVLVVSLPVLGLVVEPNNVPISSKQSRAFSHSVFVCLPVPDGWMDVKSERICVNMRSI